MDKRQEASQSFIPTRFYSSKPSKSSSKAWRDKQARWKIRCEEFSKKPIPVPRLLRLDDPIPVFKHFPLQHLAFEFSRTCKDVHIFSEEIDSNGKRRYIVSTFDQFWQLYRKMQSSQRHFYEVITEGSACKLYFDLEFKRELNPKSNGNQMIDIWLKFIFSQIRHHFGIMCNRRHVIDLDSSTEIKFSRHLIFLLPGAVFKDNLHVGNFVHHVCACLLNRWHNSSKGQLIAKEPCHKMPKPSHEESRDAEEQLIAKESCHKMPKTSNEESRDAETASHNPLSLDELNALIIVDSKGECGTFCDQGVYTKNRNFRLFMSTKFSKNSTLVAAKDNRYKPKMINRKGSFSRDENYALFLDSLICNVSHTDKNNCDIKVLSFDCDTRPKHCKRTRPTAQSQEETPSGYQASPFPRIDDFITTVINKGGVQGKIRRWVYFSQGNILMYDIDKNRWCDNIGRPHKSNHIIMIADLMLGIFYQKCHDPACRKINYKSQDKPIPKEINPLENARNVLDLDVFDDLDDRMLCNIADQAEKIAVLSPQITDVKTDDLCHNASDDVIDDAPHDRNDDAIDVSDDIITDDESHDRNDDAIDVSDDITDDAKHDRNDDTIEVNDDITNDTPNDRNDDAIDVSDDIITDNESHDRNYDAIDVSDDITDDAKHDRNDDTIEVNDDVADDAQLASLLDEEWLSWTLVGRCDGL